LNYTATWMRKFTPEKFTRFSALPAWLGILGIVLLSCSSVVENGSDAGGEGNGNDSGWLIPSSQVYVGAGRDAIPSIDAPLFSTISEIDILNPGDLVIGVKIGDEIRAYPHKILDYHEIVNDRIDGIPVAVTFCPLTGSGGVWNRMLNGTETTFGVSGLIYKNNLIAFDRLTETLWSQMKVEGVRGPLGGEILQTYRHVEMTWEAWKEAFPGSKVLSGETGFDRNYSIPAYGDYDTNNEDILFPIENEDDRLERKTLGHGLFYDTDLHVFPIGEFPEQFAVLNRTIGNREVVIAGSSKYRLAVSFSREMEDGTVLNLFTSQQGLPIIMEDNEGNLWNLFGEAVSGPRAGEQLESIPSYNAFWFAWADFFGFGPKDPKIVIP